MDNRRKHKVLQTRNVMAQNTVVAFSFIFDLDVGIAIFVTDTKNFILQEPNKRDGIHPGYSDYSPHTSPP